MFKRSQTEREISEDERNAPNSDMSMKEEIKIYSARQLGSLNIVVMADELSFNEHCELLARGYFSIINADYYLSSYTGMSIENLKLEKEFRYKKAYVLTNAASLQAEKDFIMSLREEVFA